MASILYMLDGSTDLQVFPGVVMGVTPEGATELSSHPVEDATTVTDHATIKPDKVGVQVGISPVVLRGVQGTILDAMRLLLQIRDQRALCAISTDVGTWESMALVHWTSPRELEEAGTLMLNLGFELVRIVTTQEVDASSLAPARRRTHPGTTPTAPADPATRQSAMSAGAHAAANRLRGQGFSETSGQGGS